MIRDEIEDLILLKQEGSYWDFKREWYLQEKKADLLHDIICMANNVENKDAYIIMGVDEENDYKISDIRLDSNRKNTQQIVDFLRDKKFVGGVRPMVYVQSILIGSSMLDVVIIKNSFDTPFYISQMEMMKLLHTIALKSACLFLIRWKKKRHLMILL